MKITPILSPVLVITGILLTGTVSAYDPGMVEEVCKKPQFRDFSLPVYQEPEKTEVAPESTFSFMISAWANPHTIKLSAKDQPLQFTLESNSSFHRVTAKLPAAFNGQYVRINASANAVLGCGDKYGWLIKVTGK